MNSEQGKYLICYDYGMGGIWFVLFAENEEQIRQKLPAVIVYHNGTKPAWMADEEYKDIESRDLYDIDDLPDLGWMNEIKDQKPPVVDEDTLEKVCYIPRDFHKRGDVSLTELLKEVDYKNGRPSFTADRLAHIIKEDPTIISDWQNWSEDKRTDEGWVFQGSIEKGWTVWYFSPKTRNAPPPTHTDGVEACVYYILAEIDNLRPLYLAQ